MEKPYLPPPAPSKGGEYANLSSMMNDQTSINLITLLKTMRLNKVIRLMFIIDYLLLRLFCLLNKVEIRFRIAMMADNHKYDSPTATPWGNKINY